MSDPTPREPLGRRPLPASADWRRALDVYIAGKSRPITFDEKRGIAAAARGSYAHETASGRTTSVSASDDTAPAPSFGVPVPDVLAFHRNAGTWRNHLTGRGSGSDGRHRG